MFRLLVDETSSQQQQARTCEVGEAEKHHLDDRIDVEASLHRPGVRLNGFGARRLMAHLNFQLLKLLQITEQRCM
jgi:hypothetical protein